MEKKTQSGKTEYFRDTLRRVNEYNKPESEEENVRSDSSVKSTKTKDRTSNNKKLDDMQETMKKLAAKNEENEREMAEQKKAAEKKAADKKKKKELEKKSKVEEQLKPKRSRLF